MRDHTEMSLSVLRMMIIRYGAKYMETYESDLFYDCNSVGKMKPGDSLFWMVSGTHTYLYTAKEMHEHDLSVGLVRGNRFNYRIDCVQGYFGAEYAMTEASEVGIQEAVNAVVCNEVN